MGRDISNRRVEKQSEVDQEHTEKVGGEASLDIFWELRSRKAGERQIRNTQTGGGKAWG